MKFADFIAILARIFIHESIALLYESVIKLIYDSINSLMYEFQINIPVFKKIKFIFPFNNILIW